MKFGDQVLNVVPLSLKICLATLFATGFAGLANAGLLVNASFEEPFSEPLFSIPRGPGGSLPGWVISGGGVDHAYEAWPAADGNRSLSLNWTGSATVAQAVETEVGVEYVVSFAMAAELYGGPESRTMDVVWNGGIVGSFEFLYSGQTPTTLEWEYHSLTVVGNGQDVLAFTSTVSGNYGPGLDDVSIYRSPAVCGIADLAPPVGVLDLNDINAFVAAFVTMEELADLNSDAVFDLADLTAFISAFVQGCGE